MMARCVSPRLLKIVFLMAVVIQHIGKTWSFRSKDGPSLPTNATMFQCSTGRTYSIASRNNLTTWAQDYFAKPLSCPTISETQRPCEEQKVELYGAKGQNTFLHCFTTDQETATLNVTLYKQDGNEPNTLLYPASSLTVEQKRLSLQKDSGKVMFVLHNVSFSDDGRYKCEVQRDQDCLLIKRIVLKIKECNILESVKAVQNSTVTLTCPVSSPQSGNPQVFWDAIYGDKSHRINQCPSSCNTAGNNRTDNLCERVRMQNSEIENGSLTISPVDFKDAVWYRCTVQASYTNYCSEVKVIIKDEPPIQPLNKECEKIGPFKAVLKSTFTFLCPVPLLHTQVIWGTIAGHHTVPITRCPSPCTSNRAQRHLCERVKTVDDAVNGSLIISPVESTDAMWYWVTVNATSCYTFKLIVTDKMSPIGKTEEIVCNITATVKTTAFTKGGSSLDPSVDGTESAEVTDLTVTVTVASTVSVCIFLALLLLLVKVRHCFRKQKRVVRKVELESQYAAYTEVVDNGNYLYSLVQNDTSGMCTFKAQ